MYAQLTFTLPDEEYNFTASQWGTPLATALSDIRNYLHDRLKYGELSEAARQELQKANDFLWAECEDFPGILRE